MAKPPPKLDWANRPKNRKLLIAVAIGAGLLNIYLALSLPRTLLNPVVLAMGVVLLIFAGLVAWQSRS